MGEIWYSYCTNRPPSRVDPNGLDYLVTIATDDAHSWLIITDLETGETWTVGKWTGGLLEDEEKERVPEASRTKKVKKLPKVSGGKYNPVTNNCTDYAIDFWKHATGESANGGTLPGRSGLDTPWGLENWIDDKNKNKPTGKRDKNIPKGAPETNSSKGSKGSSGKSSNSSSGSSSSSSGSSGSSSLI